MATTGEKITSGMSCVNEKLKITLSISMIAFDTCGLFLCLVRLRAAVLFTDMNMLIDIEKVV
jgi:hypothetical protein